MNAELREPGRACCGQRGTGSYRHLDSADVPRVGRRLGERTVQSAGQCRFVASIGGDIGRRSKPCSVLVLAQSFAHLPVDLSVLSAVGVATTTPHS